MKARPIIFSGPMVRALLEGRKTQTRRIINPQPADICTLATWRVHKANPAMRDPPPGWFLFLDSNGRPYANIGSPYGKAGDLLWVREAFCVGYEHERGQFTAIPFTGCEKFRRAFYRADDPDKPDEPQRSWKSSIHMPRWASRITLEITEVRAQRLQEINAADVRAEGLRGDMRDGSYSAESTFEPQSHFAEVWESIHGAESWPSNPWVWALTFKAHRTNVDQLQKAAA